MEVILYFVIMLSLFWRYRKENTIRRWVLGLYSFSALCSVFYPYFRPVLYEQDSVAYVYYTISNLILLAPVLRFGNVNYSDFEFPEKFIRWTGYILIVFGMISIVNILPQVFTLRTFLNNISDVRSAYYNGEELFEVNASPLNILANWVMYIQFFSPTFAFINFIKGKRVTAFLLCFTSLAPALNKLLIGEREACVVVLSNFVFAYIFFRPLLSDRFAKIIKKIGLLLMAPLVLFVVAMTLSRFGESDGGVVGGILAYVGEQPYNFSYFFSSINIEQQYLGGKLSFGYLFPQNQRLEGQINEYISAGEYLNVFAGIPGTLLLDFSYAALIIIMLMSLLFYVPFHIIHKRRAKKYDFAVYMLFLIYYQIIFMGLFYFDFTSKYVVYMCLILFVSYFIIKRFFKMKTDAFR